MQPAPKQRSPFVTFLYFLLGLGAVVLLVGGVGLYLFFRTERGQQVLTLAREGTALLAEAAMAPGTGELRGAGCETALAIPAGKIVDLFRQLGADTGAGEIGEGVLSAGDLSAETPVVFCAQKQPGVPDCSVAARVYASVVSPAPDRFVVLMAPRQGDLAGCSGIFAPDGTRLGDLPDPTPADGEGPGAPDEAMPPADPAAPGSV